MTAFATSLHRVGTLRARYQASGRAHGKALGVDPLGLTGTC